jgi:tetratricopeptide (TPR) repeat protein
MRRFPTRLLLVFLLLLMFGCGGHKSIKGIDERNIELPRLENRDAINDRAYNYFINGAIFEAMGDYVAANKQYAEALQIYPKSSEIRFSYAETYFQLGDYTKALTEVEAILPKTLNVWLLTADCYRALNQNDSSLAGYREAIKIDSNNSAAYHYAAAFYQQRNQLDSAIWAYEQMARLSPGYRLYQEIGNLYLKGGQTDKARINYLQSIALDSSSENTRSFLGLSVIAEQAEDMATAQKYTEKAAELTPQNILIQERLLGFYDRANNIPQALTAAKTVLSLDSTNQIVARRLGIFYYELDSQAYADSIFTSLLEKGDENIINYYYSGRIAFDKNDLEKAKKEFKKVALVGDSLVDGWLNLGIVYNKQDSIDLEIATYQNSLPHMKNVDDSIRMMFALGSTLERHSRFDSAVVIFEQIIKLHPEHSQSLNYLGYMLAEKKVRLDYAGDLIKKALKIMPENGAYIDSYGWLLFQKGEYKAALEQLLLAFKYIKNDAAILEHLGDTYNAIGDTANARLYWNKILEMDSNNKDILEKLKKQ